MTRASHIGLRYQSSRDILVGSKAIAAYIGISLSTLYRWRRRDDFPCRTLASGQLMTSRRLIDQWILAGSGGVVPDATEQPPTIGRPSEAWRAERKAELERQ